MASLELRNELFRVVFWYARRKYSYSLNTSDREDAEALVGGVEKTLMRIKQKLLTVHAGVDIVEFVKNDGQFPLESSKPPEVVTYAELKQKYLDTHRNGVMEESSLSTVKMHLGHFERSGDRHQEVALPHFW